jgi:hypothetical protein
VDSVDGRFGPHTHTGEWQSFEVRMRRRRVERLIVRAEAALARGSTDEVREALAEVRSLAPGVPQIAELERALEQPAAAPPVVEEELVLSDAVPADIAEIHDTVPEPAASRTIRRALVAAALLTIGSAGGAVWWMMTGRSHPEVQAAAAAPTTAVPAPEPAQEPSPFARIAIETVQASPVEPLSFDPPKPADDAPAPPVQLAEAPRTAAAPIATSGNDVPLKAPDATLVATLPERPEPAPTPDVPTSTMVADAKTTVNLPPPEVKTAKPERAVVEASLTATNNEDAAVRGVLNRYASAYSRLDANAAQEVWPAVNRSALSRAFDGLASQQVSLERCAVDVRGVTALATCAGSTTWSPKIGNGGPKTEVRNWTFQLAKADGDWRIVSARVQNR